MAIALKDLFENQVHIGQRTDKWNPKVKPYLYGQKNGVHIFDLQKTLLGLEKAQNFLKTVKSHGGKVLFVGTKPQTSFVLQEEFEGTSFFYIDNDWIPGFLTNFTEIRKRVDYYLNLKKQFESGEIKKYTKKEISRFEKELKKLDAIFHGIAEMRRKPDAVVVLDAVGNKLAIEEAFTAKIPVVAVLDSNADPDKIDYPIPGNDDSIKSIRFLLKALVESLS